MVLQAAIHSVPQPSPISMKTQWSASPRTNVAAMMTKALITSSEKMLNQRTVTIGMCLKEKLFLH